MFSFSRRSHLVFVMLLFIVLPAAGHGAGKPTLLFDRAHGERFDIDGKGDLQLSSLAAILRSAGFELKGIAEPFSDASLAGADAVVISGPFRPVSPEEAEALTRFVAKGGRLAVMLHIAPPAIPLLFPLGVTSSNGVIHERENIIDEDINFRLRALKPHPLLKGVTEFSARGVWGLLNTAENVEVIASTSPKAWIDLDGDGVLSKRDAVQAFGVAVAGTVGKGRFAVFGDDAIFQNAFLTGGNETLARNLSEWLRPE